MRADLRVTLKGGQLPVETTATDQTAVQCKGSWRGIRRERG